MAEAGAGARLSCFRKGTTALRALGVLYACSRAFLRRRQHLLTAARDASHNLRLSSAALEWQNHRLLVMGFQHMHFVVWDEPRRARLWRVDCGGGLAPLVLFHFHALGTVT